MTEAVRGVGLKLNFRSQEREEGDGEGERQSSSFLEWSREVAQSLVREKRMR